MHFGITASRACRRQCLGLAPELPQGSGHSVLTRPVLRTLRPPRQVDHEREARKADLARAVLAGRSMIDDEEDLFDGLTPEEIQAYVAQSTGGAGADDPYEGMSPEEIMEYVRTHGAGAPAT